MTTDSEPDWDTIAEQEIESRLDAGIRGCEIDGHTEDTYGGEHYWQCNQPGTLDVEGTWMCDDHAGERGYGPKQEEYGFDPHDGLNPTPTSSSPLY